MARGSAGRRAGENDAAHRYADRLDGAAALHHLFEVTSHMIDTVFRRIAAERGWTDSVQAEVLLRYAAHAGSVGTLRTFLERLPSAANDDDPFTDAVIAILRDPGLILDASFRRYCNGCRDILTPRQAAERWCCWRVA